MAWKGFRSGRALVRGAWRRGAAWLGLILILGAVVITLQVRANPKLSPLDEDMHANYLIKASQGQLIRDGETLSPLVRREVACRGIEIASYVPPSCGDPVLSDNQFVYSAYDTSATEPPLYYIITGGLARAIQLGLGLASIITAARLAGILWLFAGIVLLWMVLAEVRIRPAWRAIVLAPLVVTPVVIAQYAHINNDATTLAVGGAVLLGTLRWERNAAPNWLLIGLAAVAALTKNSNVVAVGCAALYLVVRAIQAQEVEEGSDSPRRCLRTALTMGGAMVVTAMALTMAWLWLVARRAVPNHPANPMMVTHHVSHLSLSDIFGQLGAAVTPVDNPPLLAPLAGHSSTIGVITIFGWLLLGATAGAVAFGRRGSRVEGMGIAALAGMLITGPGVALAWFVADHASFLVPPRYGMAVLPFLTSILAYAVEKRPARWAVAAFAVGSSVVVVHTLFLT